jgi:hypothetical protein
MGQNVEIKESVTMGDVLLIDTDRSFTGQDGHIITPQSERYGVPGVLAGRLFDLDIGINHIYVLQNTFTVRREGGWDQDAADEVARVTESFLRYYPDETDTVEGAAEDTAGATTEEE